MISGVHLFVLIVQSAYCLASTNPLNRSAEHSDPDKLHELAAVPQDPEVLAQRRKRMQQVLQAMHNVSGPSAELLPILCQLLIVKMAQHYYGKGDCRGTAAGSE